MLQYIYPTKHLTFKLFSAIPGTQISCSPIYSVCIHPSPFHFAKAFRGNQLFNTLQRKLPRKIGTVSGIGFPRPLKIIRSGPRSIRMRFTWSRLITSRGKRLRAKQKAIQGWKDKTNSWTHEIAHTSTTVTILYQRNLDFLNMKTKEWSV